MIRRPPRSTLSSSSAASDVYKRQVQDRLCDPAITFLTTDEDGCPLNLGRTVRFANEDQRKVAKARDGGCTFPGCDRPGNWCDCHHVDPYEDGGCTNITHLACLC